MNKIDEIKKLLNDNEIDYNFIHYRDNLSKIVIWQKYGYWSVIIKFKKNKLIGLKFNTEEN